jgi:hypothetical protein
VKPELYQWTELLSSPVVFVDVDKVNLDDLVNSVPWRIVRCSGDPSTAVMIHVDKSDEALGCVGGMISEES